MRIVVGTNHISLIILMLADVMNLLYVEESITTHFFLYLRAVSSTFHNRGDKQECSHSFLSNYCPHFLYSIQLFLSVVLYDIVSFKGGFSHNTTRAYATRYSRFYFIILPYSRYQRLWKISVSNSLITYSNEIGIELWYGNYVVDWSL